MAFFKQFEWKAIAPENFFLVIALTYGIAIMLLTPPYQVPDEIHHFYRAYQVSERHFKPIQKDQRLGGEIPVAITNSTVDMLKVRWSAVRQTSYTEIDDDFNIPLLPDEKDFVDFPNTALYSPISYIPQAFAIAVLRKLNLPLLYIFYGARLFTFLVWVIGIFYVLKMLPLFKWLFALLALLPMSLYINSSLSADSVTNSLAFISIAYILKCAFSKNQFTHRNFIILSLLTLLLACAKIVYTPLILLYLIIPLKKFRTKKMFLIYFTAILFISIISILALSGNVKSSYIPYYSYNEQYRTQNIDVYIGSDMTAQLNNVLNNPIGFTHVISCSLTAPFDMYSVGYVGTFGWLDLTLPVWIVILAYLVIISTAILEGSSNKITVTWLQRSVLITTMAIIICFLILSQYITYEGVGGDHVGLMQGRYFIPLFPLLFMSFQNSRLNFRKVIIPIIMVFTVLILSFTVLLIYSRYYSEIGLISFLSK